MSAVVHDGAWYHVGTPEARFRPRTFCSAGALREFTAGRGVLARTHAGWPGKRLHHSAAHRLSSIAWRKALLRRRGRRSPGPRRGHGAAADPARLPQSLREAFLRLTGGKPLLLPRLMPLNDMDERRSPVRRVSPPAAIADIPPPIAPLRRQLKLARLIESLPSEHGRVPRPNRPCGSRRNSRGCSIKPRPNAWISRGLEDLAPEEYAEHWQITLKFLEIVTKQWPQMLAEEGVIDPADHRNRIFAAQAPPGRKRRPAR